MGTERPSADTESVWMLNHSMEQDFSQEAEQQQPAPLQEELPPALGPRSDTITSSTAYFSMADVQPRNAHRYTGLSLQDGENNQLLAQQHHEEISLEPGLGAGVKRQHEGGGGDQLQYSKVIVVGEDGHNFELPPDTVASMDVFSITDIPLGGSAEDEVVAKQEAVDWAPVLPRAAQPLDNVPTATSANPSIDDYPGNLGFDVTFSKRTSGTKNKHWDYSPPLKKLFIDMNKWVQVEFRVGSSVPPDLHIRAMPVYSEAAHFREPVRRCPNHASAADPTNTNFPHPRHLVRVDTETSRYEEDEASGRLSVIFPVQPPHEGTDRTRELIKFMCLGSDVGGINRRALKVIFSLETGGGRVLGRKVFDLRICSCPRRDRAQEEERQQKLETSARTIADRLATSTMVISNQMPPPGKRIVKKETKGKYIMIPVYVDDFKNLNEMAESVAISREVQRNPAQADTIIKNIKEERKSLMIEHNPQHMASMNKKPRN